MKGIIGRRLKAAREKKGLTQAQLSELLDFKDRQTVAAIETGNRNLTALALKWRLVVLGVLTKADQLDIQDSRLAAGRSEGEKAA